MATTQQLNAWLTAAFPHQPGWRVKDRQPVRSFQQQMERVTLQWPDSGIERDVFVRLYRGYMSWWTLATPDLPQREQAAAQVAARAGVQVPRTLYTFQSSELVVTVLQSESGHGLRPPIAPEIVEHLGAMLVCLHSAVVEDTDRAHLPDISLPVLLPRLSCWAEEAEDAQLRQAVDAMAQRFAGVEERSAGLVHGDFHAGNVLADEQKITSIIDWEEAALGDPRLDVAVMESCLRQVSGDLADLFVHSYQERAGYGLGPLTIWRDLSDLRSQIVAAWVKHSLNQGRALPTSNHEVWL